MARHATPLIDLFVPLLLHDDPQVQRQSAMLLYSSYGDEAAQRLRILLARTDATERRRVRMAQEVLERYVPQPATGPLPDSALQVACLGVLRVWVAGVLSWPAWPSVIGAGRAATNCVRCWRP